MISKITSIVFYVAFAVWALLGITLGLLIAGIGAVILAIILIAGN